jgi:hypothetical protein
MSDSAWKILFAAAAVFNFIAGLPSLLAPAQALAMLGFAPQPIMLFVQLSGGLIVMFGVSYAMVARNLVLREIVWLGAIGKLLAVSLLTIYWLRGEVSNTIFGMGFGDLAFTAMFLWFLFGGRRPSA